MAHLEDVVEERSGEEKRREEKRREEKRGEERRSNLCNYIA